MINNFTEQRKELMKLIESSDEFFREFGLLDDKVFNEGAISKKHKELFLVAISIVTKCEECIYYHINECINSEATGDELIEVIKMGMMAGGSTSYPYVRKAFKQLKERNIV